MQDTTTLTQSPAPEAARTARRGLLALAIVPAAVKADDGLTPDEREILASLREAGRLVLAAADELEHEFRVPNRKS